MIQAAAATAAGGAAAASAAALLGRHPRLPLGSPARPVTENGARAYSMAMHIHSSFSEYTGSMASQLYQAAANSVDVLWWTEHDQRMEGWHYRDAVHFTSLTDENDGSGQGEPWRWQQVESGPVASGSGGGIVQNPSSPNDPVRGGSLSLSAQSRSAQTAVFGFYANSSPARWNYRDNLTGQSLLIDVLLGNGWSARDGYLELLIGTSYHRATGGRPAGAYSLSYRFAPAGSPASRAARGIEGVITIPVQPSGANPWYTAKITPADDIAALWPDLDYRDFALYELTLNAVSNGPKVSGNFDYLRFNRSVSGEIALRQQASMMDRLAPAYPHVTQRQALEVSWFSPHLNWFGGQVEIPSYGDTTAQTYKHFLQTSVVPKVHALGGLISYNHPFGFSFGGRERPLIKQDKMLQRVAADLLPRPGRPAALGADLMEVGYVLRQGVNLAHHVALWDVMSRNGVFLTGNGTSDDHYGEDWRQLQNNWITSAWAKSPAEPDLLAALAAGRVWCNSMTGYQGNLDLLVDKSCPMGSASVSGVSSRQLTASVTGVPGGGSLQVLQGAVDYAGTQALESNVKMIGSYSGSELRTGAISQPVDTTSASFVRTQVLDSSGTVVALSNPVWLLRSQPSGGIPRPRAV